MIARSVEKEVVNQASTVIILTPSPNYNVRKAPSEGCAISMVPTQPRKYYFPGHFQDKITIFQDKVYKI